MQDAKRAMHNAMQTVMQTLHRNRKNYICAKRHAKHYAQNIYKTKTEYCTKCAKMQKSDAQHYAKYYAKCYAQYI